MKTNLKLHLATYLTKIKHTFKNVAELVIKKLVSKIKFLKLKDQTSLQLTKISIMKKKPHMLNILILEPKLLQIRLDLEKYAAIQLLTHSTQVNKVQGQIYHDGQKDSNYKVRYTKLQHMV